MLFLSKYHSAKYKPNNFARIKTLFSQSSFQKYIQTTIKHSKNTQSMFKRKYTANLFNTSPLIGSKPSDWLHTRLTSYSTHYLHHRSAHSVRSIQLSIDIRYRYYLFVRDHFVTECNRTFLLAMKLRKASSFTFYIFMVLLLFMGCECDVLTLSYGGQMLRVKIAWEITNHELQKNVFKGCI